VLRKSRGFAPFQTHWVQSFWHDMDARIHKDVTPPENALTWRKDRVEA